MKKKAKFKIEQIVFFIIGNSIFCGKVITVGINEYWVEPYEGYFNFLKQESELFATKEELLASL